MSRTVSEVLNGINASIDDVLHNIMTMKDERGYEVEEHMIELKFLLDEYRKLHQTRDLSVLNHRTKEMYMD